MSDDLRAWRIAHPPTPRNGRPGPHPAAWTQREAAAHLGVSLRAYAAWEAAERPLPRWLATQLTARFMCLPHRRPSRRPPAKPAAGSTP